MFWITSHKIISLVKKNRRAEEEGGAVLIFSLFPYVQGHK
jgi:hypothetical protein